jgi:hypothetical protein
MIPKLATTLVSLLTALAGCSVAPRALPPIPLDQIPPGFEAKDCRWKIVKPEPASSRVMQQPIGGGPPTFASPETEPEPQRVVDCHRAAEHAEKCVGADGEEKPMSVCRPSKP